MLNYRQLHYFWAVARGGSIARAAERLHVTPQTISGQIGELERSLGTDLFRRTGRRLEVTDAGKVALSHADEIFQIGAELEGQLRNRSPGADLVLRVGVADVVPKSIAYRLLAPAMALTEHVRLICQEDKLERLFAELAIHSIDLVIADRPLTSDLGVRGYNHALGRSAVDLHAVPALAARFRPGFPRSLAGAPLLIPGTASTMRGALLRWFADQHVEPRIVGEFDDTALMKAFGAAGAGLFPAPAATLEEVRRQFGAQIVGRVEGVESRYFAITAERRLTHPAILAVTEEAKRALFGA
jgi:LysR family transcriptional activator of nhaA